MTYIIGRCPRELKGAPQLIRAKQPDEWIDCIWLASAPDPWGWVCNRSKPLPRRKLPRWAKRLTAAARIAAKRVNQ